MAFDILCDGESIDPRKSRNYVQTSEFTGVRIKGSDGTTIVFAASIDEAERFVKEVRSLIPDADTAKATKL